MTRTVVHPIEAEETQSPPRADRRDTPRPYWNPYAAGVGLGLTLLLAFYLTGHGLGASGAFARLVAGACSVAAPGYAAAHPYWKDYLAGGPVLRDWLVFQVAGVLAGGLIGAATAGRLRRGGEPKTRDARSRLWLAFGGGMLVGFAGRLARGCTSGQALSGGATLALGSWAFMLAVFAGGFAAAWFVRRQWR